MHRSDIYCLMGPTAIGKSAIALSLAEQYPIDIVSVDSTQVYRGMDIGTAKPSLTIQRKVPHWLFDCCEIYESYSAGQFRDDALASIQSIQKKGRIPLLVGGTMLYFRALQAGIAPLPRADSCVRAQLIEEANQFGWTYLYNRLKQIDPVAALKIHRNDPQRIQRALEVYLLTGKPLSQWWTKPQEGLPYRFINLALVPKERMTLHQTIEHRFNTMLAEGFLEEVKTLMKHPKFSPDLPAMRAVGYRSLIKYLSKQISEDQMITSAVAATRQLAKRQLTWLRQWPHLIQFDKPQNLYTHISKRLKSC